MGAAGDMLTAALLDLIEDQEQAVAELNSLRIPEVEYTVKRSEKCGITGNHVHVYVHGEDLKNMQKMCIWKNMSICTGMKRITTTITIIMGKVTTMITIIMRTVTTIITIIMRTVTTMITTIMETVTTMITIIMRMITIIITIIITVTGE